MAKKCKDFCYLGSQLLEKQGKLLVCGRDFKSHFGASADVCAAAWNLCGISLPDGTQPIHLCCPWELSSHLLTKLLVLTLDCFVA